MACRDIMVKKTASSRTIAEKEDVKLEELVLNTNPTVSGCAIIHMFIIHMFIIHIQFQLIALCSLFNHTDMPPLLGRIQ